MEQNTLYNETLNDIKERKHNLEEGKINCIPFPIESLTDKFPGFQKGSYTIVTGASKAGKTQISNFLILYNTILFAYDHRDVKVKFLYFPLEEEKDIVVKRFICYLLFTKYNKRVGYLDLISANSKHKCSDEIISIIESKEMKDIIDFFEQCVLFQKANTAWNIKMAIDEYAKTHGHLGDAEQFEKRPYIADDPEEYVFVYIDHINLLTQSKWYSWNDEGKQESSKEGNMIESISNLSKYLVNEAKNRYNYVVVVLQQQVDSETNSLEAARAGNILATKAGLKDCKSTGQDVTLLLGISNPGSNNTVNVWRDYDMEKFHRRYFRVFEIILNRFGEGELKIPLFFDGKCNYYQPLPAANDEERLKKVYNYIEKISKE